MSDLTDEEIIAEITGALGFGRRVRRPRPAARRRQAPPPALRWNDSDNLAGREALVEGGPLDGLRVVVAERIGTYRYPDVVDLTGYCFDPERWAFVEAL